MYVPGIIVFVVKKSMPNFCTILHGLVCVLVIVNYFIYLWPIDTTLYSFMRFFIMYLILTKVFTKTKIITQIFAKTKILDSFYHVYLEILKFYGLLLFRNVKLVTGNYYYFKEKNFSSLFIEFIVEHK